jgi:trimethylamine--corrinoid protein Co-methyltransferase
MTDTSTATPSEAKSATAAEPKRQRRAGGRERRDPNAKQTGPAYIERNIPTYDIMGEESLLKIEAAADRILAEVGLDIRDDDECLAMFRKSGAKVDGMRVRFEPGHLREILETAPREFTQHARNPARSVRIGGNSVVFAPAYGSPFVMDLDRGRRYGTLEDFQNFIKLAYSCPWLHHSGGTVCEPTDVPVNKRHLDMV